MVASQLCISEGVTKQLCSIKIFSKQLFRWSLLVVITVLLVYCYLGGIRQVREKVLKLTPAVVGEPSIIFLPSKNE